MVYITADGTVGRDVQLRSTPGEWLRRKIFCKSGLAAAGILAAIAMRRASSDPFAGGAIPAARRSPDQHWDHMAKSVSFVRTMTEPLVGRSRAATRAGKEAVKSADLALMMDRADFGGVDGHVAEADGDMDMEQLRVTRCSTTRSGVTAYFCGADVATNQDAALGLDGKGRHRGVRSFRGYLKCRHETGRREGAARRSVYRLGIGAEDHLAGMSHAWNIVAQPDGSFMWLQSYVSQYSLSTWLKKADATKESGLAGRLTLAELMGKLDSVERLMKIQGWTEEANADYHDLFGVDKKREAAKGGFGSPVKKWEPRHRLTHFGWDEACEYPEPNTSQASSSSGEQEEVGLRELPVDKCDVLLAKYYL